MDFLITDERGRDNQLFFFSSGQQYFLVMYPLKSNLKGQIASAIAHLRWTKTYL